LIGVDDIRIMATLFYRQERVGFSFCGLSPVIKSSLSIEAS
jgi:hypothetical protein